MRATPQRLPSIARPLSAMVIPAEVDPEDQARRAALSAVPASPRAAPPRAPTRRSQAERPAQALEAASHIRERAFWLVVVIAIALAAGAWARARSGQDPAALSDAEAALARGELEVAIERASDALEAERPAEEQQRALWVRIQANLKAKKYRAVRIDMRRYLAQAPPDDPQLEAARAAAAVANAM